MKHILNILKVLLVMLFLVVYISGVFLLCRFYANFQGKEWVHLCFAIYLFFASLYYFLEINKKRMIKIILLLLCVTVSFSAAAILYFKNDTIHNIFNKNNKISLSANIWYLSKYAQRGAYEFVILDNGKIYYRHFLMPCNFDEFDINTMDYTKVTAFNQLKAFDGSIYITKSKYEHIINMLDKIKVKNYDVGDCNSEYGCYAYYEGSDFCVENYANEEYKNEILTSIFNSINLYDPYPLRFYDELFNYVKNKWKSNFIDILMVSTCMFAAILFIYSILKICTKRIENRLS